MLLQFKANLSAPRKMRPAVKRSSLKIAAFFAQRLAVGPPANR
jgi:hypothetical protein